MRHIPIPGEDELNILTGNGDVPHRDTGCASTGIHIFTENGDVPHQECRSSPGMGMCLTRNAHPHGNAHSHLEWGCASLGMHNLIGNEDVLYRECTSSPGMDILTRIAHSLYRGGVKLFCLIFIFLICHCISFPFFRCLQTRDLREI